jgi:hypothetical protein
MYKGPIKYTCNSTVNRKDILLIFSWSRGGVVVKALPYKPAVRVFDSKSAAILGTKRLCGERSAVR